MNKTNKLLYIIPLIFLIKLYPATQNPIYSFLEFFYTLFDLLFKYLVPVLFAAFTFFTKGRIRFLYIFLFVYSIAIIVLTMNLSEKLWYLIDVAPRNIIEPDLIFKVYLSVYFGCFVPLTILLTSVINNQYLIIKKTSKNKSEK